MDKKAMYSLSYGLFVVTANVNGKDNGCITNTAIQVTSEPNRIALAVNRGNLTNEMIKQESSISPSSVKRLISSSLRGSDSSPEEMWISSVTSVTMSVPPTELFI